MYDLQRYRDAFYRLLLQSNGMVLLRLVRSSLVKAERGYAW